MKIAVISCIHGNSEAMDAVLLDIDQQKTESIFCLGDLVGYGPDPNAVVDKIRSLDIPTCQGCWDEDIVEGVNACECHHPSLLAERRSEVAHKWTNEQVNPETRAYLAQLPLILRQDNLCFVHGSPDSNHEYLLPEINAFTALERVISSDADVLFCGHTHVPYVRTLDSAKIQIKVSSADCSASEKTFKCASQTNYQRWECRRTTSRQTKCHLRYLRHRYWASHLARSTLRLSKNLRRHY